MSIQAPPPPQHGSPSGSSAIGDAQPVKSRSRYGDTVYMLDGRLHRVDGPAWVALNGDTEWRQAGLLHRLDGPAMEFADGGREWWVGGVRHRDGGPAVEHPSGMAEWWYRGTRHRVDGPAVFRPNGHEQWWYRNQLHRVDGGPAETLSDGTRRWLVHGDLQKVAWPTPKGLLAWRDGVADGPAADGAGR